MLLKGVDIRSDLNALTRELKLTTHLGVHAQVKLGEMDVIHDGGILGDGGIHILHRRAIYIIMSLHSDSIDRHTGILHLLHHVENAVAFAWVGCVVVVVEKLHVRVGLTCESECLCDEFVATELIKLALTVWVRCLSAPSTGIVCHCLVDHVPTIYHVLVATHHGDDMFAQTLVEHFFRHRLSILVLQHPVAELGMPAEAVATQLDAILTAEVGDAVGTVPVPYAFSRMNRNRLHVVLCGDAVILFFDDRSLCRIGQVALVHGHSNRKVVFIGVFQSCVILRNTRLPLCTDCQYSRKGERHCQESPNHKK